MRQDKNCQYWFTFIPRSCRRATLLRRGERSSVVALGYLASVSRLRDSCRCWRRAQATATRWRPLGERWVVWWGRAVTWRPAADAESATVHRGYELSSVPAVSKSSSARLWSRVMTAAALPGFDAHLQATVDCAIPAVGVITSAKEATKTCLCVCLQRGITQKVNAESWWHFWRATICDWQQLIRCWCWSGSRCGYKNYLG